MYKLLTCHNIHCKNTWAWRTIWSCEGLPSQKMLFMKHMFRRERKKSILAVPLTLRKGCTDTQSPSEMRRSNLQLPHLPMCGTKALIQSQKSSGPFSPGPNHTRGEGGCAISKHFINQTYLNKRSELALRCQHRRKFLLIPSVDEIPS